MSALLGYSCEVFAATDLRVTSGANMGDGLGQPCDLCAGDIYQLHAHAAPMALALDRVDGLRIAAGSAVGQIDDTVALIGHCILMAPDGDQVEVLMLEVSQLRVALPLTPLSLRTDYTLIQVDAEPAEFRLSDLACASFVRGTRIMRADGTQAMIETLQPGDVILTRDHGPQPLRWIGQATLRAKGSFAPVVIGAGVLGNLGDLCVSQHHRMFLYQRGDKRLGGRAEVLVQARYLVDGVSVRLRIGGFVDYVSLVFDQHEILYAEGVPAESLMVTEATVTRLPDALASDLRAAFPGLRQRAHFAPEAGGEQINTATRAALIRPPAKR
jgi:hypothetical protein